MSQASLVRHVLDTVAMGKILLPVFRPFLISIIPPVLHPDPVICHRIYMLSIDNVINILKRFAHFSYVTFWL